MKKALYSLILLFSVFTAFTYAEYIPVNLRNTNDDLSGIVSDNYSDILMNPAEIVRINRWTFNSGIDNLLDRNELVAELTGKAKPKSITVSSPILFILGKQDSNEFKKIWIGSIYGQHNSQQYGLNPFDDINPNLPGVQQTGLSWNTKSTEYLQEKDYFHSGTSTRTAIVYESSGTMHYLNVENMNLGVVYGWQLDDKTNLGLEFKYYGNSSQEPNNFSFLHEASTRSPVRYYENLYENELAKSVNNFSINLGLTKAISQKSVLGLSGGAAYLSESFQSGGLSVLKDDYYDLTVNNFDNYFYEKTSKRLDDDNDTKIDEDGIDGSPGNLPGVDDDGDGRIDEDPVNTNQSASGIGIPFLLSFKTKLSEKFILRSFIDMQILLAGLRSNTSNYSYIEDTYDYDGDSIIGNNLYKIQSSTITDSTGIKLGEYLQLGFGFESKVTKRMNLVGGIKFIVNAFQMNTDRTKDEYYSVLDTTSTYTFDSSTPVQAIHNRINDGYTKIYSSEYILQVPFGLEFETLNDLWLHLGFTWQLRHFLVNSHYSDNVSVVDSSNGNRRSDTIFYYLGFSMPVSNKMNLCFFNSFNSITRNSFLRWRVNLNGYL